MKNGFFVTVALVFFLTPMLSFAADGFVCNGCSDSQYESFVKSKYGFGAHTAYVFDTVRWKVTKWLVEVEREGGIIIKFATELGVESNVSTGFDKYQDMTEELEISASTFPIDVPPSLYNSAFQVVGDVDAYNDIYDWLYGNTSWYGWTTNWMVTAALDLIGILDSLANIVELNFADGSMLKLRMEDFSLSELGFKFEYQYAEDANGNVIPAPIGNYSPDVPVGWRVGEYISNGGYSAQDTYGLPYTSGWHSNVCYGVACVSGTSVCTVAVASCP